MDNEDSDSGDSGNTRTEQGTPVRQIAVFLPNRTGAFVSILDLLRSNHVVVLGLSVQDSIDNTVVRLVVSDPETVETIFMEKGIPFNSTDLVVVELRDGAEQMPDCLRTLLKAETNIHFIYPLLTQPNGKAALALCVEDNLFGDSVLSKAGFKVLRQEDLSR
ncbi:MAG: acetolactate synthase [Verrucomicrobiales bacterium]|nr:acetolactate synthase [Verrucomicrobiales bacterium]